MFPLPEEVNLSSVKTDEVDTKAIGKIFEFSFELREKIHAYSKENHSSVFKLLMSALSIYISRVTGLEDITVGTVNHNRSTPQHQAMVGMFVSTFPIRFALDNNLDFKSYTKYVGDHVNDIIKHRQQFPFDVLATDLREKAGIDPSSLLNIMLIGHPNVTDDPKIEYLFPGYEQAALAMHVNLASKDAYGILEV
ncbi:MAG: hypothetical protein K8S00_01460 [Bacteroidales bacterium]|nr:hypothetical protein [Bacteroidales bacterium]